MIVSWGQIVGCACPVSDEWTELAENFVAVRLVCTAF